MLNSFVGMVIFWIPCYLDCSPSWHAMRDSLYRYIPTNRGVAARVHFLHGRLVGLEVNVKVV